MFGNGSGIMSGNRLLLPNTNSAHATTVSTPSASGEDGESSSATTAPVRRKGSRGASAAAAAAASAAAAVAASADISPPKDEDGKYKCQNCEKTYLHAKHLKRHMLRHSGSRPYTCGLCGDSFARSDILKRHFAKCAVRRGNPQNLGHLDATKKNRDRMADAQRTGAAAGVTSMSVKGSAHASGPGAGSRKRKGSGKACDQCVRMKIRCDLGAPCAKCESKGVECAYLRNQRRSSITGMMEDDPYGGGAKDFRSVSDPPDGHGDGFRFPPPRHPNAHMADRGAFRGHQHSLGTNQQPQQRLEQRSPASSTSPPSVSSSTSLVGGSKLNDNAQQRRQEKQQARQSSSPTPAYGPRDGRPLPDAATVAACNVVVDWNNSFPELNADNPAISLLGSTFVDTYFTPQDIETTVLMPHNEDGIDSFIYNFAPQYRRSIDILSFSLPGPLQRPESEIAATASLIQHQCDSLIAFCFSEKSSGSPMSTQIQGEYHGADTEDLKAWLTPDHVEHFVNLFFTHYEEHFPMIHKPSFDLRTAHDALLMSIVCIGAVYSKRGITVDQVRRLMDYHYMAMAHRISRCSSDELPTATRLEDIQAMELLHTLLTWHGNPKQRAIAQERYDVVVNMARRANLFRSLDENELRQECANSNSTCYCELTDVAFRPKGSVSWSWQSWITQERRNRCAYTIYLLDTAYVLYYNVPPKIKPYEMSLPMPSDDAAWEAWDGTTCAAALGTFGYDQARTVNPGGTKNGTQLRFLDAVKRFMSPEPSFPPACTNVYSKFIIIHALHVQLWFHQMHAENPDAGWMSYWLGTDPAGGEYYGDDRLDRALDKWINVWYHDLQTQHPDPASRVGFSRSGTQYYHLGKLLLRYAYRRLAGYHAPGDKNNVKLTLALLQHSTKTPPGQLTLHREVVPGEIDENYGVEDLTYDMKLLFKPIGE